MRKLIGTVMGVLCLALVGPASSASALTAADFADWTAVTDPPGPGDSTATGTLHGASISLSGNVFTGPSDSNTSGTFAGFNDLAFTPSLATSDVVGFGSSGSPLTLQFGYAVTNPVFHVNGLAWTLRLPPGTQVTKLSGDITVSGRDVVGAEGPPEAKGSFRLEGTFSSTSLQTSAPCACGEQIQIHVGGPAPPPAAVPGGSQQAATPPASGTSCPAGTSAGVSCQSGGATVTGTSGNDTIVAPAGAKVVNGGGGNDTIDCRASKAACQGGAGKDSLRCRESQARCDGGAGNDKLDCKQSKGACAGGSGQDNVNCQKAQAGTGCAGGTGNDKLNCQSGRARCEGGSGNDKLVCSDPKAKACSGGSGRDRIAEQRSG